MRSAGKNVFYVCALSACVFARLSVAELREGGFGRGKEDGVR